MPRLRTPRRTFAAAIALLVAAHAVAQDDDGFRFSGVQRTRYESLDNQFRAGFDDSDRALALQTSLVFEWRRGDFEVLGEIMDSRAELTDERSFVNGTVTNTLEPIQAYVAWRRGGGTLRMGRMTLDLGKRRILGRNRFRNTVNNFAGADWAWSGADERALRAFYFVPVRALPTDFDELLDNEIELDRGVRNSRVAGVLYQPPKLAGEHVLELYFLDYELDSGDASAADLASLGARLYRDATPGRFSSELEAVVQRGESGGTLGGTTRTDLAHRAYFVHLEIGYTFDRPWRPTVALQLDRASGDRNPADARIERYNTLFGPRRFDFGPTGIYGIANRSNLASPGVRLTLRPLQRLQTMFSLRALKLDTARDGWAGSGWRDATGSAGESLGTHLEGSFTWTAIPNRLSLETGFAKLWAGRFPEQTAGALFRGNPTYVYAALTTTF